MPAELPAGARELAVGAVTVCRGALANVANAASVAAGAPVGVVVVAFYDVGAVVVVDFGLITPTAEGVVAYCGFSPPPAVIAVRHGYGHAGVSAEIAVRAAYFL